MFHLVNLQEHPSANFFIKTDKKYFISTFSKIFVRCMYIFFRHKARATIIFAVLASTAFPATSGETVPHFIDTRDPSELEQAARATSPSSTRLLARGIAAATVRRDTEAISILTPLSNETQDIHIQSAALNELAAVYLRQGRFDLVVTVLEKRAELKGGDETDGARQTRIFANRLRSEPSMSTERFVPGRLRVRRDMAGLARIIAAPNGVSQEMVVDTGASFSTVSQTTASKLGLRFLEGAADVGNSVDKSVTSRLAIADTLNLGETVFRNVVFIVVPDQQLTFAGGVYKIEAILGAPVLINLHRISISKIGGDEILTYAGTAPEGPVSNLLLDGLQPFVQVGIGDNPRTVRMFLDTGAKRTTFMATIAQLFPAEFSGLGISAYSQEGVGGRKSDDQAKKVKSVDVKIGGKSVPLRDVPVLDTPATDRYGVIGSDVLRSGKGFTLDFDNMTIALE